jgi:mono/diheme cytochrome c family protein
MRPTIDTSLKILATAVVLTSLACGGGGDGGDVEKATLTGQIDTVTSQSIHVSALPAGVQVRAVNEDGVSTDPVTPAADGSFTLEVPTGHDYVVIFEDANGVIASLKFDADDDGTADSSVFAVVSGVVDVTLGTITINSGERHAECEDDDLHAASGAYVDDDNDSDDIPDAMDGDDDNDGIDDGDDVSGSGRDRSYDHDNDGIDDADDDDDDNDGEADLSDPYPRDFDDDGEDDDRDSDDDESDENHPRNTVGDVTGSAEAGAAAFVACVGCHGADGAGGTVDDSIRGESAREIAEALREGESEDGIAMPAFPDLVDSAADIATFLTSDLVAGGGDTGGNTGGDTGTGPDVTVGGEVFASSGCVSCHGTDGSGTFNIRNATETQVASALQNGPGSMPPYPDLVGYAADLAAFLSQ